VSPRATVRLQLTRDFDFDAARACVDYYAALGVSHYYLSPVFRARPGSTHGYDTVDFARISGELGGADGLARLAEALRARSMGIVLDLVPNHMGVASNENAWWNDVLAHGRGSDYAGHFDIDWTPENRALHGKVLLPFLGKPYAEALADAEIAIVDEGDRGLRVGYHDWRWPLAPASLEGLPRDPAAYDAHTPDGRDRLHRLLERQHYRLDDWRTAPGTINWRRFFDITELAALRMDDPRVFADVHKEIFALFSAGAIDGVRVDHVDGLAFPLDYCRRLREELDARRPADAEAPAYVVVEKVFAAHEPQRDWGVAGTTGYDFMDQVGGLLHNPAGLGALDVLWRRISGRPWEFRGAVASARRQVLAEYFPADLERVARAFHAVAERAPHSGHVTYAALKRALVELVVAFPVYRCYGMPGALPPEDSAILAAALERAVRELDAADYDALDFLARCLRDALDPVSDAQREAAVRFQQLTAPIAAKAIEDTVFYRETRLLSRNEVGSDPNVFAIDIDEFHAACAVRGRRFPHGLTATATHDHKRGEDARARLAVLSDAADAWSEAVSRWMALNARHRRVVGSGIGAPDALDEFTLYQTLVGAWPFQPMDDAAHRAFAERIARWWRKALREGKRHSSWIAPNTAYEEGCMEFLGAILERGTQNPFVEDAANFIDRIAAAGAINGLVQTFLRLATPGVPDLYQGCEFWDLSLVDPDNRRPVDYAARAAALAQDASLADLVAGWRDGRIKQRLIATVLRHRAAHPLLYASGDYVPLAVTGERTAHLIAFERRSDTGRLLCLAARWPLSLAGGALAAPVFDPGIWGDTTLELPHEGDYVDVLRGGMQRLGTTTRVSDVLRSFPVALGFAEN